MSDTKKFDVDRFVDELELDEELAGYEDTKPTKKKPYRKCPRCGEREWRHLYTNAKGRVTHCTECIVEPEQ